MKLLYKSSLYLIIATIIVFLLSGVIIYFMLKSIIQEEVDEQLIEHKRLVVDELNNLSSFDHYIMPKDSSVVIGGIVDSESDTSGTFTNAMRFSPLEEEEVPFRVLSFAASCFEETRMISIYHSTIENDDVFEAILFSLLIIFGFIIIAITLLNYMSMNRLWYPFRRILDQITGFDFRNKDGFKPVHSNIDEFQDLNKKLIHMTDKLTSDYIALKEFSENASHEMQTPLAIIQSKLELLFQKNNTNPETMQSLNAAYQAVNRLSRLHQELNLLTRIENKEFTAGDKTQIRKMIQDQVDNFSDIIQMKNLTLETELDSDPTIRANSFLMETLLSNLFNNSIKHNIEKGEIQIRLTENEFIISNSGPEPSCATDDLFQRFRKGNPASSSTGLGLSLVKQICEYHYFSLTYSFQQNQHIIKIRF